MRLSLRLLFALSLVVSIAGFIGVFIPVAGAHFTLITTVIWTALVGFGFVRYRDAAFRLLVGLPLVLFGPVMWLLLAWSCATGGVCV
jgi:hypothetical protein